jgi:tetratricopeptide (TPR) repeat protein
MRNALFIYVALLPITGHAADDSQSCQQAFSAGNYVYAAQAGREKASFDDLLCAGRAQQALGDNNTAEKSFAEAEHLAREPFDTMLAITLLARSSQAAGKSSEALAQYDRSLQIARKLKQSQGQMVSLNESGQILQAQGNVKVALEHFHEAYPFAANDNERSECNQLISAAYSQLGDFDRAFEYQLKSVMLEEGSGDLDHYLNARLELAKIAMIMKDYKRSNKELKESLNVARVANSAYWEARTLLYLGRLERVLGNTEHAQTLLKNAQDIANKINAEVLGTQISSELKQP